MAGLKIQRIKSNGAPGKVVKKAYRRLAEWALNGPPHQNWVDIIDATDGERLKVMADLLTAEGDLPKVFIRIKGKALPPDLRVQGDVDSYHRSHDVKVVQIPVNHTEFRFEGDPKALSDYFGDYDADQKRRNMMFAMGLLTRCF